MPPTLGGAHLRVSSPPFGDSTFQTSAPRSARVMAHQGPASTRERSRTLMPSRGVRMKCRLSDGSRRAEDSSLPLDGNLVQLSGRRRAAEGDVFDQVEEHSVAHGGSVRALLASSLWS